MMAMSKISALMRVIGVTLLVTSTHAIAEGDISPSSQPKVPANWELLKNVATDAVELTNRSAAGALSTLCKEGSCGVFIEPVSGCVPGAKYPLLINSAKQVGVVPASCAIIPGEKEGAVRYVVLLQDQQAMIKAMMDEMDLTIAFPTQAGQMDVLVVSMTGIRQVLGEIMPGASGSEKEEPAAQSHAAALIESALERYQL